MSIIATSPPGSDVYILGEGAESLADRLQGRVGSPVDVRVTGKRDVTCDIVQARNSQTSANHIVFTCDAAWPHPQWAQAITPVFGDPAIGAAGPILRGCGPATTWSTA